MSGVFDKNEGKNTDNSVTDNVQNEEQEDNEKTETLDVNSEEVQKLYGYVKATSIWELSIISNVLEKGKITANDLTQQLKNFLGYRRVAVSDIKTDVCRNYPKILYNKTTIEPKLSCGLIYTFNVTTTDDESSITRVISESVLKEQVENIFGKNSYNKVDFFGMWDYELAGYKYDPDSSNYVYVEGSGGGTGPMYNLELISAYKTNNTITIVENVTSTEYHTETVNANLKYNYTLGDDGKYYFSSVEKENE